MKDNEIINALENFQCVNCDDNCCRENEYDINCPQNLAKVTLALINGQKTEIAELQLKINELEIELKAMRGAANSYKAEVERLKAPKFLVEYKPLTDKEMYEKMKNAHLGIITVGEPTIKRIDEEGIKSEAIKEFAERLKKISRIYLNRKEMLTHAVSLEEIDNLVKEMTEQKEREDAKN